MARLDAVAHAAITERLDARRRSKDGGDAAVRHRGAHTGVIAVWRTDADLRCFDLSLDPSDRKYGTLWGRDPLTSNYGAVGFARFCTQEAWLSTLSGLSSNAALCKTAPALGHSAACLRQYGMTKDSRLIWTLPIIHNAGQLYAMVSVVLTGMTTVLMPKVDIWRMLELPEEQRVTHAISIGPVSPQIIAYPGTRKHDLSSLRLFATMSRADSLEAHIGVPCTNLYGTTEGLLLCNPPEAPAAARHGTQGASGCALDELRLLDPDSERPVALGEMGELCFRGPSSLRGHFGAPEATGTAFTSDGFFRTGDMMTASVTEGHTYYAFQGRLRDNINRGGEEIGCEEVEAFVSQHLAVADAKLVAMPDPIFGEKGCIFIVPRSQRTAPTLPDLVQFLTEKGLAKFKCPERIEVVATFPVTRVGKVDKPALKAAVAEALQREQGIRRLEDVR